MIKKACKAKKGEEQPFLNRLLFSFFIHVHYRSSAIRVSAT